MTACKLRFLEGIAFRAGWVSLSAPFRSPARAINGRFREGGVIGRGRNLYLRATAFPHSLEQPTALGCRPGGGSRRHPLTARPPRLCAGSPSCA
jgi:hypothetical protein